MDHSVLYPRVVNASEAIATNKPEMEAYLGAMQRNFLDDNFPQEQQQAVFQARQLLDVSPDLPTFLQAYRQIAGPPIMGSPQTTEQSATALAPNSQSSKPSEPGLGSSSEAPRRPVFNRRRRTRTK